MKTLDSMMIFPKSEESAKFVTGISGWVDRDGRFWGNDERMARYCGSTHKHCECGEVVEQRSYCKSCARKKDIEKYQKAQKIEWDREIPIYSQYYDEYFFDCDTLTDFMIEQAVKDPEELELFICEPVKLSEIQSDYWCDDLPENGELPPVIEEALDALNAAIRESDPVSWTPGKFAAIVDIEGNE